MASKLISLKKSIDLFYKLFVVLYITVAHLNLGLVLALLGLKEEAIEVYRRCSQLDGSGLKDPRMHETTKISALFNLGRLYSDEGQHSKAIEIYFEAIQRMPPHYQPQVISIQIKEAIGYCIMSFFLCVCF